MRQIALLIFSVPILAACSGDLERRASASREVRGDTTIISAGAPAWGDSISLIEELRIGELDGADEYTFGNITGIEISGDEIYVVDGIAKDVRVYGANGRLLRRFGGDGAGPGELRSPAGIAIMPDGRIAVRDYGNRRYNIYSPAGESLASWPIPGGYWSGTPFVVDTAGRLYNPLDIAPRGETWKTGLEVFGPDGTILDTITPPTWGVEQPMLIAVHTSGGGTSRSASGVPFSESEEWALSPSGYFVGGSTGRYAVESLLPDGKVLRFTRNVEAVPVQDAERAAAEANTLRGLRRTQADYSWDGPPIPSTKPFFRRLRIDAEGRVWVGVSQRAHVVPVPDDELAHLPKDTPRERWIEPAVYDVFKPDGEYLGAVQLPQKFEPHVMRDDRIWGVLRDDMDVPYVVRYRIAQS